ncbi:hypothetical protein HN51_029518 [Arachis hypogaea]
MGTRSAKPRTRGAEPRAFGNGRKDRSEIEDVIASVAFIAEKELCWELTGGAALADDVVVEGGLGSVGPSPRIPLALLNSATYCFGIRRTTIFRLKMLKNLKMVCFLSVVVASEEEINNKGNDVKVDLDLDLENKLELE